MNLRQFAISMKDKVVIPLGAPTKSCDGWTEMVLYRDPPWQIGLVVLNRNVSVRRHHHKMSESLDMLVSGGGTATVGEFTLTDGCAGKRFLRVPKGTPHEGGAGENGAVYLSFQKWDGEPGFVSDDWHE